MKRYLVLALLFCFTTSPSHAFRCGDGNRYIASEGMHKHQILKDCGEPASREIIGYDKRLGSYRQVEEWVYIIYDTGNEQVYLIKFDKNGIAKSIEWLGEKK